MWVDPGGLDVRWQTAHRDKWVSMSLRPGEQPPAGAARPWICSSTCPCWSVTRSLAGRRLASRSRPGDQLQHRARSCWPSRWSWRRLGPALRGRGAWPGRPANCPRRCPNPCRTNRSRGGGPAWSRSPAISRSFDRCGHDAPARLPVDAARSALIASRAAGQAHLPASAASTAGPGRPRRCPPGSAVRRRARRMVCLPASGWLSRPDLGHRRVVRAASIVPAAARTRPRSPATCSAGSPLVTCCAVRVSTAQAFAPPRPPRPAPQSSLRRPARCRTSARPHARALAARSCRPSRARPDRRPELSATSPSTYA